MLGAIPQRAPLANSWTTSGSPPWSRYVQTKTRAPVKGMTPIKPPRDGNLAAMAVARRTTATVTRVFVRIKITTALYNQDWADPAVCAARR